MIGGELGYSKSKLALGRIEPFLKLLLDAESDIEFPSDYPQKLLYAIRDGLNVAKLTPSSPYKEIKSNWRFKLQRNSILCEQKIRPDFTPVFSLANAMRGMVVSEVTELLGVIAYVVKHKAPRYEFTNVKALTGNPLKMLEKFANEKEYTLIQTDPYLILEKNVSNSEENGGVEHS